MQLEKPQERNETVLSVEDLEVVFDSANGVVRALDCVSFAVRRGEILGLVGESGSGKSLTASAIMGLIDAPGRVRAGIVRFLGQNLLDLSEDAMRAVRGRRMAMVFQDPAMTLNPMLRIETQMVEAIVAHEPRIRRTAALKRATEALDLVGIPSPARRLRAFPHELSGGMRQRVVIAIALLHRPALIIADEPTTALDVTIQAQILEEMGRLCREAGTALLWISHDLALLSGFADRIGVMYAGRLVEQGQASEVLSRPGHPYTQGLIGSVPSLYGPGEEIKPIPGATPSLSRLPSGCAFRSRCSLAIPVCTDTPPLVEVAPSHVVRCFRPGAAAMEAHA